MKKYKISNIIKILIKKFKEDEVTALGAQMTFYLILSFFPFLIFLITLLSYTPIASNEVVSNLSNLLPNSTYNMINSIIQEVITTRSTALLSIGMIATLWTASSGVAALIKGINKAYNQKENRGFLKLRSYALVFTLALTLVILLAFIMLIFGEFIGHYIFGLIGLTGLFESIWDLIRFIIPIVVILFIFIFFYVYAPNKPLSFSEVLPGAIFTTVGWLIISLSFSFYVNNFGRFARMYGSIGGIIALLVWLYISSLVILIGGELNAVLSNKINTYNI